MPGELESVDADSISGRPLLFYAAVFTDTEGYHPVAFVKRHNPASVLNSGLLVGQWGQTITRAEAPTIVFARDFDLVIDADQIASLKADAIQWLFSDIEVLAAAVPKLVDALDDHPELRLSDQARVAIDAACGRRRLLARRLQTLLSQPHLGELTPAIVRSYVEGIGQDAPRFVDGDEIVVADDDVEELIDVLNQAQYLGRYDGLLRRADRSSLVRRA
jgi:hypothetical protein